MRIRDAILEVMRSKPGWYWFKSQIAREVRRRYYDVARNEESIYRELRRMVADGLVIRDGYGRRAQYILREVRMDASA